MKFLNCILLLTLCLLGCAGNRTETDAADAVADAAGQHFLWKISDENSSVWILGSVHFGDSSFYPLDSVVESAFANAEELAVEIDMSDDSVSNAVAEQSLNHGMLPEGKTLSEVISRDMWNTLDSLCASWNFPIAGLMQMRPWMVATTLSVVAVQRAGIDPNLGVDMVLLDRAASDGKAIVGLETAEEQIGALADTSETDSSGIYYLKTTLREISELDSMVAQIVRAWKTGNDSLLRVALGEEDDDDEDETLSEKNIKENLTEKIYTGRNAKMAESVAEFLKEDRNVFVVVGAAHLALEKDNVIDILKRKGFKVERF
ncbi:MAG: TraB/GumN family protein [Fibrobacter sp.]|nr:TraB/GumN family protein [Fibrobacter sp.]